MPDTIDSIEHSPSTPPWSRSPLGVLIWIPINLLAMAVAVAFLPLIGSFEIPIKILTLSIIFAPAAAAAVFDGRWGIVVVLTLTMWAVIAFGMYEWSQTDGWRRDCGLGQAFAIFFAAFGSALYPVAAGVVFGVCRFVVDATTRFVED